jgi:hypothetical protein
MNIDFDEKEKIFSQKYEYLIFGHLNIFIQYYNLNESKEEIEGKIQIIEYEK